MVCEKGDVKCEGKPCRTSNTLTCPFQLAAYEMELICRSSWKHGRIHAEMGSGHTNQVELAHSVLIHFRPKSLHLHCLHYQVSTNLRLLQSNQGFMEKVKGTKYHWYPDLLEAAQVPLYDGIMPTLKLLNARRVKRLQKQGRRSPRGRGGSGSTSTRRYSRIEVRSGGRSRRCSMDMGRRPKRVPRILIANPYQLLPRGKQGSAPSACKCTQEEHPQRLPLNKAKKEVFPPPPKPQNESRSDIELKYEGCSDVESDAGECMVGMESEAEFSSDEDDTSLLSCVQLCDCQRDAHKWTCFLNPRNRERKYTRSLQLGKYVCVHNRKLGNWHVVCRVVDVVGECYQPYCLNGVLDKAFSSYELTPIASERIIPLDNWHKAGKVSMCSLATDKLVVQPCNCSLPSPPESID